MVLQNWVILQDGVPSRLHFYDHIIKPETITDRDTGLPTTRNALTFEVDRLDGRKVASKFSILAEKLAAQFAPYFEDKAYRDYDFIITQRGEGRLRNWSVQVVPLKSPGT